MCQVTSKHLQENMIEHMYICIALSVILYDFEIFFLITIINISE